MHIWECNFHYLNSGGQAARTRCGGCEREGSRILRRGANPLNILLQNGDHTAPYVTIKGVLIFFYTFPNNNDFLKLFIFSLIDTTYHLCTFVERQKLDCE